LLQHLHLLAKDFERETTFPPPSSDPRQGMKHECVNHYKPRNGGKRWEKGRQSCPDQPMVALPGQAGPWFPLV